MSFQLYPLFPILSQRRVGDKTQSFSFVTDPYKRIASPLKASMDKDIVIVAASRAAVGTFGWAISRIHASSLGVKVMQVLLDRSVLSCVLV